MNSIQEYHLHIYFDTATDSIATKLMGNVSNLFHLEEAKYFRKPVGPHKSWNCIVAFPTNLLEEITVYLIQHHENLSILIHAETGDSYKDHTENALWLGEVKELDLAVFNTDDQ